MKHKWLIIPLLLTFLPVLVLPCAAAEEFVSFDFYYSAPSGPGLAFPSSLRFFLLNYGIIPGQFEIRRDYQGNISYKSGNSFIVGPSQDWIGVTGLTNQTWSTGITTVTLMEFTSSDVTLFEAFSSAGYDEFITPHYRFVLDYFPTDVLSYFFYRFFENNYILWCIGIWVLAISFKLIFSRSGVRGCMNGF